MSERVRLTFWDAKTEVPVGEVTESEWVPRIGDVVLVNGSSKDWRVFDVRWIWPTPSSDTRAKGSYRPLVDVKVNPVRWWVR